MPRAVHQLPPLIGSHCGDTASGLRQEDGATTATSGVPSSRIPQYPNTRAPNAGCTPQITQRSAFLHDAKEKKGLKEALQSRDAWMLVPNGAGGSFARIPPRSPAASQGKAEHRSPLHSKSSSLNPRQMNNASSNKPRYHDINNIYFQAKLQPGLLIPVIKANGSSVISFASQQAAPCLPIPFVHPFPSVSPGGDRPDPPRCVTSRVRCGTDRAQSRAHPMPTRSGKMKKRSSLADCLF